MTSESDSKKPFKQETASVDYAVSPRENLAAGVKTAPAGGRFLRPAAGARPSDDGWRSRMSTDDRMKIVDKIVKHLENLMITKDGPDFKKFNEIRRLAIQFEDKVYAEATTMSQPDYVRKISAKMVAMEKIFQINEAKNPSALQESTKGQNPADPGSVGLLSKVGNANQSLTASDNKYLESFPLLNQNLKKNSASIANQASSCTASSLPSNLLEASIVSKNSVNRSGRLTAQADNQANSQVMQMVISSQQFQGSENPISRHGLEQKSPKHNVVQSVSHFQSQESQNQNSVPYFPGKNLSSNERQQEAQPTVGQLQSLTPQKTYSVLQQPICSLRDQMSQQSVVWQERNAMDTQLKHNLTGHHKNPRTMPVPDPASKLNVSFHHHQHSSSEDNTSQFNQQKELLQQQQQQKHSQMHILQQRGTKSCEFQQASHSLFDRKDQQSTSQSCKQEIMSHMHPEPPILQPQQAMQLPSSMQQKMLQGPRASSSLLQPINILEQHRQLVHSQRGLQEVSHSTSTESAPIGNVDIFDWKEELHGKILSMREIYFEELKSFLEMLVNKVQQYEKRTPEGKQAENLQFLKRIQRAVESFIKLLTLPRSGLRYELKEKLPEFEKKIRGFLHQYRRERINTSQKPEQLLESGNAQFISRQQKPQVSQLHQNDSHLNQISPINSQQIVTSVEPTARMEMEHRTRHLQTDAIAPKELVKMEYVSHQVSDLDPIKIGSCSLRTCSMQQGSVGSFQVVGSESQLTNTLSRSLDNLKPKICSNKQGSYLLQQQHLEQHASQTNQLTLPQQNLMHKENLTTIQQYPYIMSQRDLLANQHKLMHSLAGRIPQLHKADNSDELKQKEGCFISKDTTQQHCPEGLYNNYHRSHLQADRCYGVSVNEAKPGQQKTALAPPKIKCVAVVKSEISESPLQAELTSQTNVEITQGPMESRSREEPIRRLVNLLNSVPEKVLRSSIHDIICVVTTIDGTAGLAPDKDSNSAIAEDLVAVTKSSLEADSLMLQDGESVRKKMKRDMAGSPSDAVSSAGSRSKSFMKSCATYMSESESSREFSIIKQKFEINHVLLDEIRTINHQLIDTVVSINSENVDFAAASGKEVVVIECSFKPVSLSQSLRSWFASSQMSPNMLMRFLVPSDYPKCSPLLLDEPPNDLSKELEDFSVKAQLRFREYLGVLSQPVSVAQMAKTWDACARKVIDEYAQQFGGGSFSSRYRHNCLAT